MIAGIVLAGGRSLRMGRPKALLQVGDETFLERVLRTLKEGGCDEVVVVLNVEDRIASRLISGAGARSTLGAGAGTEQIESLRAGLRALSPASDAAVILPVDHPLVEPSTVAALIDAFRARRAPILRATCEGRHGHPVLFSASVFEELLTGDTPEGARSIVRGHAGEVEDVEVEDRGVTIGVDTPDDYEEHFGEVP